MRAVSQVAESHRHVAGRDRRHAQQAAWADLAELGLAEAGGKLPGELSGGMAQRVAFAAASAGGAPIVIADEPTKGSMRRAAMPWSSCWRVRPRAAACCSPSPTTSTWPAAWAAKW